MVVTDVGLLLAIVNAWVPWASACNVSPCCAESVVSGCRDESVESDVELGRDVLRR